jgi:hypothetical protein
MQHAAACPQTHHMTPPRDIGDAGPAWQEHNGNTADPSHTFVSHSLKPDLALTHNAAALIYAVHADP